MTLVAGMGRNRVNALDLSVDRVVSASAEFTRLLSDLQCFVGSTPLARKRSDLRTVGISPPEQIHPQYSYPIASTLSSFPFQCYIKN